ncbi:MAG: hypothetical protein IBX72_04235 [Nitrospirae bacterium]|nr:hypothetical protein [Nitrospirota bacterium]
MISIKYENEDAVLIFPKRLISNQYVQSFIERLNIENITQKSRLTEKEIMELSEKIKKDWWKKNRDRFIGKMKKD